jgi:hypothetical protein
MAVTKPTGADLNFAKTTDANGWTKYDYGSFVQYRKRVTYSIASVGAGGVGSLTVSSSNLPSGFANISGYQLDFTYSVASGWGYALSLRAEMATNNSALGFSWMTHEGNRAYNGFIDVTLTSQ